MWEWLKHHAGVVPCELDTVIGSIGGKVLFTMAFPDTGLALSHLNSYPRESLGGSTPYDVVIEKHGAEGKAFLDALGIVRIPAKTEAKQQVSISADRPIPVARPSNFGFTSGIQVYFWTRRAEVCVLRQRRKASLTTLYTSPR